MQEVLCSLPPRCRCAEGWELLYSLQRDGNARGRELTSAAPGIGNLKKKYCECWRIKIHLTQKKIKAEFPRVFGVSLKSEWNPLVAKNHETFGVMVYKKNQLSAVLFFKNAMEFAKKSQLQRTALPFHLL